MTELKLQIAATALNNMMRSSFFSICAVNDAAEVLGCNAKLSSYYDDLHALHCIHWRNMPREVREAIPMMIAECLALPPQFVLVDGGAPRLALPLLLAQDVTPKRPLLKRILARLAA